MPLQNRATVAAFRTFLPLWMAILVGTTLPVACQADEPFIPRRQSQPPGPALSPEEALAKMVVPEGFHVELVASEPDLINPVAMAFDDRGRLFVTESFEYPRREPGPGRDRVKILEDTNGDGRFDSVKVFADGLNIPSGIAVGYGGVWVANAPDILFLEDTNGDDRADKQTVVVTGFGRDDTHELPNALTWGPDGYLYGLNGVFNRSIIKQDDRKYDFTCAMFRIDPVTHRFELFAEGTSNPWGIAFDTEGEAFISACVIDHLWHLSESGYYHRQGGPYPPHTWKIDSIVDYRHQAAAYCGIEYFDSPAYPAEYRNKLYMGNIHGGCVNVDSVSRHGSTYRGKSHPDFLTANDVWFMPVAQKVGPDGCLYVLDWYDRYHCYQDANADPAGVDRGHGRLYRIVHGKRPEIAHKDLGELSDEQLIELLEDENIFYRQRAAVLLAARLQSDRGDANQKTTAALWARLNERLQDAPDSTGPSLQLLTSTLTAPGLSSEQLLQQVSGNDPLTVAWAVRAAGNRLRTADAAEAAALTAALQPLAAHSDPRVRLQVAIAAGKLDPSQRATMTDLLLQVLRHSEDDGHLPRVVWRNLEPQVLPEQETIVERLAKGENRLLRGIAPRISTRLLAEVRPDLSGAGNEKTLRSVLAIADVLSADGSPAAGEVLGAVLAKLRTSEIRAAAAAPVLRQWAKSAGGDHVAIWQLRSFAGDQDAHRHLTERMIDSQQPTDTRLQVLSTLAVTHRPAIGAAAQQWIADVKAERSIDERWRDALLTAVVQHAEPAVQQAVLQQFPALPIGVQAMVAGLMVQRQGTAALLMEEIAGGRLAKDVIGPNQIRQLAASTSPTISEMAKEIWGAIRIEDSPTRQAVVAEMTDFLLKHAQGNPQRGIAVYDRVCGQCHVMHGRGYEVGPDITRNGRGNFEQLIVSVFDPSLVIGDAYKSVTVLTTDGRVISGLVTERSGQRIALKVQGGKVEVVPMDDVEEIRDNDQSLMPEGLEGQMSQQELADLFALLSLEKPPTAADNSTISGTPERLHRAK